MEPFLLWEIIGYLLLLGGVFRLGMILERRSHPNDGDINWSTAFAATCAILGGTVIFGF